MSVLVAMVRSLSIAVLAAFGVALTFETTNKLWKVKTDFGAGTLPTNEYSNVLALSPVECVVTALTYNRSLALYDRWLHQCLLYDDINETEMSDGMGVLFIQDMNTCGDLDPARKSGVYRIAPIPGNSFDVYCDVESEGGPWTVIQNRQNKEVDFYRNWDQYKDGFGDLLGNFWLGNDHIHTLTATPCILRVQVETVRGAFWYVEYATFQISSEVEGYKLSLSGFSGNVSDAFVKNNGQPFSTPDRNNDGKDCVQRRRGPWWHKGCTYVNLNGLYEYTTIMHAMSWQKLYGDYTRTPLKTSRMMLRKP